MIPGRLQGILRTVLSLLQKRGKRLSPGDEDTSNNSLQLRPLSPVYDPDQHKVYVEILKGELTRSDLHAPRNIALTGHYGSGKSSVLLKTQQVLEKGNVKVINLSLPSLGIGDGRLQEDGNTALNRTNLIQKEIVKQLLYRKKPSDTPASRYSRLDEFQGWPAGRVAAGVGAAVTGFALIARVPEKVRAALPSEAWSWINGHLWGSPAEVIPWLNLLFIFLLAGWATWRIQRLLQQRIRVTELAAGSTRITLSDASSSYFDEYLDEIVYFFQISKTAVVIFEDLDRFKDPYIFETLRELNMLLNNADQIEKKPIRFVYAIRDSIFEQLDDEIFEQLQNDAEGSIDTPSADLGETRRLMSTNRTKFFDLVVPMVPFISHRTSRDLIRQELGTLASSQQPSNEVVNIVSIYLTDMRLIKNICNEYEIFQRRILTEDGLKELTADRLFSSIVYKNLYLSDYEKIRNGTSLLDNLYHAYREWVTQQAATARSSERRAKTRLRRLDAIASRAVDLGTRLQKVLFARNGSLSSSREPQIQLGKVKYSWDELLEPEFWRTYLQSPMDLLVYYHLNSNQLVLSFDQVQTLMGFDLSPADWTDEEKTQLTREIDEAVEDQKVIPHISMSDALKWSDRSFSLDDDTDLTLADFAVKLFDGSDLVLELLREGLIDENFTLYITEFPGQAISSSAMNFIIKAVQPDQMDIEYHFGTGQETGIDDIKAVIDAESSRLFSGKSVYNIEIFDYLFAEDPDKLDEPIRRLAAGTAENRKFLDAYLTSGNAASMLVERLSGEWEDIFAYLLEEGSESAYRDLLDSAIKGVRPELAYTTSEEQGRILASRIPDLPTTTEPQKPKQAVAIAKALRRMDIQVDNLNAIADPLRDELSQRSIYPITRANLEAILGGPDSLSLDSIKKKRESDVYAYVLVHLDDYLNALDEAADVFTVVDPDWFAEVLSDVAETEIGRLEEVARRASGHCMLKDLDQIEVELWPAVARAHRFTLTAHNVASYIDQYDVDSSLANWLTTAGVITVKSEDSTLLEPLALNLLNAVDLDDDVTLRLVDGLELETNSLAAEHLQENAHSLLPDLIEKGLVADNAEAYALLEEDEWAIKKRLISVSENFPTYMTELSLSTGELTKIASEEVPDAAKDALLAELEMFTPGLDAVGATALAEWASAQCCVLPADTIVTLATKGGPGSARPILELLGTQAPTIELELLKSALQALGAPYSQLTTRGWRRPSLKMSPDIQAILRRLEEEGIVSSFSTKKNKKKDQHFEVNMRRPR